MSARTGAFPAVQRFLAPWRRQDAQDALERRIAVQEARLDQMFVLMGETLEDAGYQLGHRPPPPARHLRVVRGDIGSAS